MMKSALLPVLAALSTLAWSCTHAAEPADAAANYYGNSEVFRDHSGKIVEIINFRPDHTMRLWRNAGNDGSGTWREGKWVINSGQDSTILCHGPDDTPAKTYCHSFAPYKNIGDHWISIEKNGRAERPGGIPVVQKDGNWVMKDAAATPVPANVLIMSLEKGLVEPPTAN
jgi:hypothetical protein